MASVDPSTVIDLTDLDGRGFDVAGRTRLIFGRDLRRFTLECPSGGDTYFSLGEKGLFDLGEGDDTDADFKLIAPYLKASELFNFELERPCRSLDICVAAYGNLSGYRIFLF